MTKPGSLDPTTERQHLMDDLLAGVKREPRATGNEHGAQLIWYGIPTPKSRAVAKGWRAAHKDVQLAELLPLVNALWAGNSHEERHLAFEVLSAYPRYIPKLARADFDHWRHGLVDWATTDHPGTVIFGPWLAADLAARTDYLWTLIADPDLWSRRLALVGTVPVNRGHTGQTLPNVTLGLVERVEGERDPMIVKAVSWALRELSKTHPDRVAAYVEAHRATLPALVTREVGNKLRTGLKSGRVRNDASLTP